MEILSLIQSDPLVYKNDSLIRVRNLMNRSLLPELPVVSEDDLIGTITSKNLVNILPKVKIENLLASHIAEKDYIKSDVNSELSYLAKEFLSKKRFIACIFKEKFIGYVQRRRLLSFLLDSDEEIKNYVSKDFVTVDLEESIKKIIKLVKNEVPILILKDGQPFTAFSPEELYFIIFVSNYAVRKIERDFETLRGDERKILKMRINQAKLRKLKEEGKIVHLPPLTVADMAKNNFLISETQTVGDAAKIMLNFNKNIIAVKEGGVISDLSLLKALV